MRLILVILLMILALGLLAQTPPNNPDIRVFSASSRGEPSIGVNFSNSSQLMVSTNGQITAGPICVWTPWGFSTDGGVTWPLALQSEAPPPPITGSFGHPMVCVDRSGRAYYVVLGAAGGCGSGQGIFVVSTTNFGAAWSAQSQADNVVSTNDDWAHVAVDYPGMYSNNVYVAWTDFGVSTAPVFINRSTNQGQSWGLRRSLAIGSSRGQGANIAVGPNGEVYVAWAHYGTGTAEVGVGFTRSTDGGATFSPPIVAFPMVGIRTSNGGIPEFNGAPSSSFPYMDVDRSNRSRRGWIYIAYPDRSLGQSNVYMRRSTDSGQTWSDTIHVSGPPVSPEKQQWLPSIAVDQVTGDITVSYSNMDSIGANFLVNRYAAHSTDGGNTWERWVISDVRYLWAIQGGVSPSHGGGTVALGGTAWSTWSDNRTGTRQTWLERINYGSVWVQERGRTEPTVFKLGQNYPNPFNASTRIGFEIQDSGLTSLKVYDVLGREVAMLVNDAKPPGRHEVTWDASAQPSGVYFYRLTTGPSVSTKRMILMR